MNYLKLYCKIVRNEEAKGITKKQAKEQGLYVEGHHVFPQSIYGKTSSGNKRIIYVTPRVHYILHALLEKAFIKRYGLEHWKTKNMTYSHIKMKGYIYNKRYINDVLYEKAKERQVHYLTGRTLSEETKKKISQYRVGKFSGRDNPNVFPIKIYFDDGNIITYEDGIGNFCKEYEYSRNYISFLMYGKRTEKYKNIIKVEKLEKQISTNKKTYKKSLSGREHKSSIPIRIYFSDGRVEECFDGGEFFCKKNPQYAASIISAIRRGEREIHKDIIKVEELTNNNYTSIIKKYYNKNFVPIKIYFKDGRTLICENGATEFCKENPQYIQAKISAVSLGKRKFHKDIIKVERLVEW